jgi:glycosyltransferase involved in cell wall biosynthesis
MLACQQVKAPFCGVALMARISIITPFYNGVCWLGEAVRSVLAQTFQDWELIVVNDGSTEAMPDAGLLISDRVHYLSQEHRGRSAARNAGLKKASGEYICFLDADDIFLPTKLEKQIAVMEQRPDALLSHTSYARVDSSGVFLEHVASGTFAGRAYPKIVATCPIATPTVMVRRAAIDGRGFEESVSVGEDIILWSRIAMESPILGIQEALTKVRMHRGSAASDPLQQLVGKMSVLRFARRYDKNLSIPVQMRIVCSMCLCIALSCKPRNLARLIALARST